MSVMRRSVGRTAAVVAARGCADLCPLLAVIRFSPPRRAPLAPVSAPLACPSHAGARSTVMGPRRAVPPMVAAPCCCTAPVLPSAYTCALAHQETPSARIGLTTVEELRWLYSHDT